MKNIIIYKLHYLLGTYKKFYTIKVDVLPIVGQILTIPQKKYTDCVIVRHVDTISNNVFTEAVDVDNVKFTSLYPIEKDTWKIDNMDNL